MLDIEMNPNLKLRDVRSIQDCLTRNNKSYMDIRTEEWLERKNLKFEEENTKKIKNMHDQELATIKDIIKKAQDLQLKREELYIQKVKEMEEERAKVEKKIEKEALARAKKKKRRGGKPKKN